MKPVQLIALVVLGALLGGCAGQTALPGERAPYIQSQKEQARQLRQEGKLAQSLAYWRSILPMGSPDEETKNAISELEREIKQKVSRLENKARTAYRRGNQRTGDNYALKILALKPGHKEARQWLVASKTERARVEARSKAQQEYAAVAGQKPEGTPPPSASESAALERQLEALLGKTDYAGVVALADQVSAAGSTRATGLLRTAHIGLGENAIQAQKPDEAIVHFRAAIKTQAQANDPLVKRVTTLQQAASDEWYRKGRKEINSDLDAAIASFSKALEIKPDHATAKSALKRARTLKKNLEKIENR